MSESELSKSKYEDSRADLQAAVTTSRVVHRKIIVRLLLCWLLLNLTIGGAVLWLEIDHIQQFVHELALKESITFSGESAQNLDRLDSTARKRLSHLAEQLVDQHFVVVELYDSNQRLQLESVRQGQENIEGWIDKYRHRFPRKYGEFSRQFHLIKGKLFLVILVPLKVPDERLLGYFEGIYQVDSETLYEIKNDLFRILLFVTLGITFTTFVMYPIVLTLNRALIKLASDLLKGNLELMNVLGCAIAERDSDTNIHNYRVTFYALRLGEMLGLSRENSLDLMTGAFLHDVGKIGIRDPILLKQGKLTLHEFDIMKTHVSLGVQILSQASWLGRAKDVVEFHHERYDGTGYPRGLKGEAIPLNARIFTIVDVFDALTSKRAYKDSWSAQDALDQLKRDSGSHFDPKLVDIFLKIAPDLVKEISLLGDQEIEAIIRKCIAHCVLSGA